MKLKYHEKPNYYWIISQFELILGNLNLDCDYEFDWIVEQKAS
jgi:hypothetical protein